MKGTALARSVGNLLGVYVWWGCLNQRETSAFSDGVLSNKIETNIKIHNLSVLILPLVLLFSFYINL